MAPNQQGGHSSGLNLLETKYQLLQGDKLGTQTPVNRVTAPELSPWAGGKKWLPAGLNNVYSRPGSSSKNWASSGKGGKR